MKALTRAEREPEAAREMLKRIDDDSAFAPLRRAAEVALLDDASLIVALKHAGPRQAELAAHCVAGRPSSSNSPRALAALETDASGTVAPNHKPCSGCCSAIAICSAQIGCGGPGCGCYRPSESLGGHAQRVGTL